MDPHDQYALRPGSEHRLRAVQRAFRALHAKYDWRFDTWRAPWQRWRRLRYWLAPALFGVLLGYGALAFHDLSATFGSVIR